MAKDSEFPYAGMTIHFATQHGKEKVLDPLFSTVRVKCRVIDVNTDVFGTFSGEVDRVGTIRETLQKKIHAAMEMRSGERLYLASEGTFGPDPRIPFLQANIESLLLYDRDSDLEIYAEHVSRAPNHAQIVIGPRDDFRSFLQQIGFPEQGVIVHPDQSLRLIFKGLHTEREVGQAIIDCFRASKNQRVAILTDLRANHNPTRQMAIYRAGQELIQKVRSLCPRCESPGFGITGSIPGLPCAACGEPSPAAMRVCWECAKCSYFEERPRPDGKATLDPEECDHCNP